MMKQGKMEELAKDFATYQDVIVEVKISVVAKRGSHWGAHSRMLTQREEIDAGPMPTSPLALGYLLMEMSRRVARVAKEDMAGWEETLMAAGALGVPEKEEAGQGGSC